MESSIRSGLRSRRWRLSAESASRWPLKYSTRAARWAARLSRSDEYEADAYAAALLTKSGIGVAPQISLFEKLARLTQSNRGAAPAWLLSHPKPEERIAAIRRLSDGWGTA